MKLQIFPSRAEMAVEAASRAAATIRDAIAQRAEAHIILATGASQLEFLENLTRAENIDWGRVTAFHLDEYIGLPDDHPASFRKYLRERFVEKVPGLRCFHYVDGGAASPEQECARLGEAIRACRIDLACIGIGENGHVAFNDPPADFDTEEPFIVVELDHACRMQQFNEGWFASLDEVPRKAISMSVNEILRSRTIVCTVPDARKAEALKHSLEGKITPTVPASILQKHENCFLFTDADGASLLSQTK